MKGISKRSVSLLLLIYSVFCSYLIVVLGYFPFASFALVLASLSTILYLFRSEKSGFSRVLYFFTQILALFILCRANDFLIFLNIMSIFFLGSLMITPRFFMENSFGFLHFLFLPFLLLLRSFSTRSEYSIDIKALSGNSVKLNKKKTMDVLASVLVSVFLFIIIVPLLSSANPIFHKYVNNFFELLNLKTFFERFFSENIFIWIVRFMAFGFFAFFIPKLITYIKIGQEKEIKNRISLAGISLDLPKVVMIIVLSLFFLTQFQLYFSTAETLLSMGITHSEYAREVFAQLSVVALVILGLVYNDKTKNKLAKTLTLILILEGVFLTFIAFKSVYDYSFFWGFTHKRLWGFTVAFWSLGVFSLFAYKYLRNLNNIFFVKGVIVFSGFVLVMVNVFNFDYLIYRFKKSITHRGVDYYYLSGLSSDSMSYREQYEMLVSNIAGLDRSSPELIKYAPTGLRLSRRIERLQDKYRKVDFRAFNLSEYLQYQEIKSIDTSKILMQIPLPIPDIGEISR